MTARGRLLVGLAIALALLAVGGASSPAGAQADTASTPTLTLNPAEVDPGQEITVIFTGFSGRLATLSVCGNQGARGAADCNMPASRGVRLYHVDATPTTTFVIAAPPVPCPCVVRAESDLGEVVAAPIEIRGVPIEEVLDPHLDGSPLVVSIAVSEASSNPVAKVRSLLGGETTYDVEVTVENQATESFSAVQVHGSVGHGSEVDLASFDLSPGVMAPGRIWSGSTTVTVSPPVLGSLDWRVTASGAGPVATAESSTKAVPWLLVVLTALLAGILVAIVVRFVRRRRERRRGEGARGAIGPGPQALGPAAPVGPAPPGPPAATDDRPPALADSSPSPG